ncbi:polysaccharide deacetylase family protein [Candidatus Latescibacterota bacterium]
MAERSDFWGTCQGGVSLTFDDGMGCHLDRVVPALDERGLRGSFYLLPRGDDWEDRLAPWREVAAAGHEIGNHTLSHTCSGNYTGVRGGLELSSLERIEDDILQAQQRLLPLAPHQDRWTFCYPCYCTFVGQGRGRRSYVPVVARHFLAGRAGGEYGFGNHPATVDLACFWAQTAERMGAFEMIGLAEELTHRGQWVVFVFHAIDGSRLSVASEDFLALLNFLARRRDSIRTATVAEIAGDISHYQAVTGQQRSPSTP